MRIIGCDLHARQQTVAMLDTTTGEVVRMTLSHEGNNEREFYSKLPRPVRVGIEATGSMTGSHSRSRSARRIESQRYGKGEGMTVQQQYDRMDNRQVDLEAWLTYLLDEFTRLTKQGALDRMRSKLRSDKAIEWLYRTAWIETTAKDNM